MKNFFTLDQIEEFEFEEICQTKNRISSRGSLKITRVGSSQADQHELSFNMNKNDYSVAKQFEPLTDMEFQVI